ncbi:MAG TPA: hypothetical protein VLL48_01470, partial [Longimicrobiales bacterium]|nr:hypothetical protein [Longimicrobiales bacterium]
TTPEQVQGPAAVSLAVNGLIRSFQEAYDSYIRYASYITDEMIASGTITDRTDVDFRDVIPDNATLTTELFIPLQTARELAEEGIGQWTSSLGDEEFAEVEGTLREGIAWGNFVAGYTHVLFGELYCRAVIDPEGSAVTPDEAVQAGLGFLQEAQARAADAGLNAMSTAAVVGQGRAQLWLGQYDQAATTVSGVADDFAFAVEYSSNTPGQNNELFQWTWGVLQTIRWTIGNGTAAERDFELWPYLAEWESVGLIDPDPGLTADNAALDVTLQLLYTSQGSDILLASGWEARMIEAEAELRQGDAASVQNAEDIVNALLTDPGQASNPMRSINPDVPTGAFAAVDFTAGDLEGNLTELARARSAGLWLSGERQATLRRFRDDGVDLYPVRRGDDVCLPIVQRELDTNPNVS